MNLNFARVWFISSLVVLSFVYGTAVGKWELFPYSFLDRATDQAREVLNRGDENSIGAHHDRVFDRQGTRTHEPEQVASGVTAITSWWKTSEGPKVGMRLIDREGTVLHEWLVDRGEVFSGLQERDPTRTDIQGSLLLPNGDVLFTLENVGTVRLNSCREILWTQVEGNHHSIAQAEDGSFWIPGSRSESAGKYPGLKELGLETVWLDRLLHVSEEGDILADISVMDLLYENNLGHIIFQYNRSSRDVTHLNDIEPLSPSLSGEYPMFDSGDLLVSLRRLNLVFVVDPETRDIKWYSREPFIWQHDPDFIGDGWIGIFDNNIRIGNSTEEGSQIVALQPHSDSTHILFQPNIVDRFYTYHRGKWQMLDNGNMLLTEEETGRALEVSAEGKPVWEWVHEPYGSKVPSVTKATRYGLTHEDVADWPCSSVDSITTAARSR